MVLHKMDSPEEYARFLRKNGAEVQALYQDLLISVTSFFRNPEAFEVLQSKVFPEIVNRKSPGELVRAWVLGSSTGEEVYSIAISFLEFSEGLAAHVPLQIFGTDLNEENVQHARSGIYPKSDVQEVTPERLRRFFVEVEGGYQVSKPVRDMCVFATQNVLADPPFSRMDLISCRNVLIYLEPAVQAKLIPLFHYALNPRGFLFLGSSETTGKFSDLFATEDKKNKFYSKKGVSTPISHDLTRIDSRLQKFNPGTTTGENDSKSPELGAQKEADRLILSRFAPAGVLINADMEILQFRGSVGLYIEPAECREVPAVAVTGYASVEDRNRALAAGYKMFIPKPVELAELAEAVASLARPTKKD